MSYDKAIIYKKTKRKPYYGSKAIDRTCCNHGTCLYCQNNRLHQYNKMLLASEQALEDYKKHG